MLGSVLVLNRSARKQDSPPTAVDLAQCSESLAPRHVLKSVGLVADEQVAADFFERIDIGDDPFIAYDEHRFIYVRLEPRDRLLHV